MSLSETLGGVWGINLLAICVANLNEVRHCLAVLILYAVTYFLLAPLHAVILLGVGMAYGIERRDPPLTHDTAVRAAERIFCVETLVFWVLYWGMVLGFVPLYMSV